MGKEYLVEGAKLICVQGGKCSFLKIPGGHGYTSGGKKKANCADCKKNINISDFGSCKKNERTHMCKGYMELKKKWENIGSSSSKIEMVGGEEAVTLDSVLICNKGGIILPVTSGQGYENELDRDAFQKRYQKAIMWAKKGKQKSCKYGGDPVNLNTGNFIYEREGLIIPGTTQLSFRIFYNAMDRDTERSLGRGWHHNNDVYIKSDGQFFYICLEDGRELLYECGLNHRYLPVNGTVGTLEKEKDGFLYCDKEGIKYFFEEDGKLIARKDRNGNTDTFAYDDGQLVKVSGANGGELKYFYNKEGKLIKIQDHTGREIQLWYQYGNLCKLITELDHIYTYQYNENGKLESVVTPRGIVGFRNKYDSVDRISKQELPDGGIVEIEYNDQDNQTYVKQQNGSEIICESNDKFCNTKTLYADGEENFEYNDHNQRTLRIDKNGNQTRYRYDQKGNLIEIENALKEKTTFVYDDKNYLTALIMPDGAKIQNFYDKEENLIMQRDPMGNCISIQYNHRHQPILIIQEDYSQISIEYDQRGNIKKIIDAMGNSTEYKYDDLNRVIELVDRNGNETCFLYDAENKICESINAAGYKQKYEYNQSGKIIAVTDYDNYEIRIDYDVANRIKQFEDKEGQVITYTYDLMGNIEEEILPNGAKRQYRYDSLNRLTNYTDEIGNITSYEYDANGNCIKVIEADGGETFYRYDELNRISQIVESGEMSINFQYNAKGQVTKIIYPGGLTEEAEYDASGRKIKTKDIYGNETLYQYNALGMPVSIIDGAGGKTDAEYYPGGFLKKIQKPDGTSEEFSYDGNGNIVRICNQSGYYLVYDYDSMDRLVKVTSSMGEKLEYGYDAVGNMVYYKDGNGNMCKYAYSPNGRITAVEDAHGNKGIYQYDCMGRLISVEQTEKPAKEWSQWKEITEINEKQKHITVYERNLAGQLIAVTDALGNKEAYSYDSKGRMIEKTDRCGYKTLYSYDSYGNMKNIKYADGRSVDYEYNALKQLVKIKDWMGIICIEPDAYGKVSKFTDYNGNLLEFQYNSLGERKAIIYPDGEKIEYFYDKCMRLQKVRTNEEEIKYCYNSDGYLKEKIFPGTISTCYEYDQSGRIIKIENRDNTRVIDRILYSYDIVGNKIAMDKFKEGIASANGHYQYDYDCSNRLINVRKDGVSIRKYIYDGYGNRIRMINQGKEVSYVYNVLNQLSKISKDEQKEFFYDQNGNLTNVFENNCEIAHYAYDTTNHLTSFVNKDNESVRYFYNGLGQRVKREDLRVEGNSGTTYVEEYITDITKRFNNVLQIDKNGVTKRCIWDDGLLEIESKQISQYALRDDLGTPFRLIYKNGVPAEISDYDEFGNQQYSKWMDGCGFGFTGYYKDIVSGNYYGQAREYMPFAGRFVSEDSIGQIVGYPKTINKYQYCYNNPGIYIDRDGRFGFLVTAAIGAVAGFAVGGLGTIISDAVHGREIDWKKALVNGGKGALAGGLIGSGVGAISAIATSGGIAAGTVTTMKVGALVGGLTNGVIETGSQIAKDEEIDMGKVAISGAGGAAAGMVMGSQAGKAASIVLNTGISTTQAVATDCYTGDTENLILDAGLGAVSGAIGGWIGGAGATYGNAPVRTVVNVTFGINIYKEHLEKEVIRKAFVNSAVKSGVYGIVSAFSTEKIKGKFEDDESEMSENEECSYAN